MGCIKNIKSFLGIKYEGPHDFEIVDVGVHMINVSNTFKVNRRCRLCGCRDMEWYVAYNQLLHLGFTPEQLDEARGHQI